MRVSIPLLALIAACSFSSFASAEESVNPYQAHKEAAMTAVTGAPWSAERHLYLMKKVERVKEQLLSNAKRIEFPIEEEELKELFKNSQTIPFFAYSSLIDKNSPAAKAISEASLATHTPAVGFGLARIFNRVMDASVAEKWGPLARPNDVAILNAFEKEDAATNGVVLQLSFEDLQILAKREVGYDLVPILVTLWDDAVEPGKRDPVIFLAYTFIAPDNLHKCTRYTCPFVNPIPGYVAFLQNGLKPFGKDFEAMWWATTYLADKHTQLGELVHQEIDLAPPSA